MTPFIFKYISGIGLETIYSIFILFNMLLYFLYLDNGVPLLSVEKLLCSG